MTAAAQATGPKAATIFFTGTWPVIHLVWGSDYGSHQTLLRAFTDQPRAEQLREACLAYMQTKPEPPATIEDTPENDAAHARWWNRLQRWQKHHPGGPDAWVFNTFEVTACPLE